MPPKVAPGAKAVAGSRSQKAVARLHNAQLTDKHQPALASFLERPLKKPRLAAELMEAELEPDSVAPDPHEYDTEILCILETQGFSVKEALMLISPRTMMSSKEEKFEPASQLDSHTVSEFNASDADIRFYSDLLTQLIFCGFDETDAFLRLLPNMSAPNLFSLLRVSSLSLDPFAPAWAACMFKTDFVVHHHSVVAPQRHSLFSGHLEPAYSWLACANAEKVVVDAKPTDTSVFFLKCCVCPPFDPKNGTLILWNDWVSVAGKPAWRRRSHLSQHAETATHQQLVSPGPAVLSRANATSQASSASSTDDCLVIDRRWAFWGPVVGLYNVLKALWWMAASGVSLSRWRRVDRPGGGLRDLMSAFQTLQRLPNKEWGFLPVHPCIYDRFDGRRVWMSFGKVLLEQDLPYAAVDPVHSTDPPGIVCKFDEMTSKAVRSVGASSVCWWKDNRLQEKLLSLTELRHATTMHIAAGKFLADTLVLDPLKRARVDPRFLFRLVTDGAPVCSGAEKGAFHFVRLAAPHCLHNLCACHEQVTFGDDCLHHVIQSHAEGKYLAVYWMILAELYFDLAKSPLRRYLMSECMTSTCGAELQARRHTNTRGWTAMAAAAEVLARFYVAILHFYAQVRPGMLAFLLHPAVMTLSFYIPSLLRLQARVVTASERLHRNTYEVSRDVLSACDKIIQPVDAQNNLLPGYDPAEWKGWSSDADKDGNPLFFASSLLSWGEDAAGVFRWRGFPLVELDLKAVSDLDALLTGCPTDSIADDPRISNALDFIRVFVRDGKLPSASRADMLGMLKSVGARATGTNNDFRDRLLSISAGGDQMRDALRYATKAQLEHRLSQVRVFLKRKIPECRLHGSEAGAPARIAVWAEATKAHSLLCSLARDWTTRMSKRYSEPRFIAARCFDPVWVRANPGRGRKELSTVLESIPCSLLHDVKPAALHEQGLFLSQPRALEQFEEWEKDLLLHDAGTENWKEYWPHLAVQSGPRFWDLIRAAKSAIQDLAAAAVLESWFSIIGYLTSKHEAGRDTFLTEALLRISLKSREDGSPLSVPFMHKVLNNLSPPSRAPRSDRGQQHTPKQSSATKKYLQSQISQPTAPDSPDVSFLLHLTPLPVASGPVADTEIDWPSESDAEEEVTFSPDLDLEDPEVSEPAAAVEADWMVWGGRLVWLPKAGQVFTLLTGDAATDLEFSVVEAEINFNFQVLLEGEWIYLQRWDPSHAANPFDVPFTLEHVLGLAPGYRVARFLRHETIS